MSGGFDDARTLTSGGGKTRPHVSLSSRNVNIDIFINRRHRDDKTWRWQGLAARKSCKVGLNHI